MQVKYKIKHVSASAVFTSCKVVYTSITKKKCIQVYYLYIHLNLKRYKCPLNIKQHVFIRLNLVLLMPGTIFGPIY